MANRLSSVDTVSYTFDDNGNLLDDGTSTYTYDAANRLTAFSGPPSGTSQQSATYAYRCNGESTGQTGCESDRVSQTVDGITTNYVLDPNSALTQVLQDGTNTYTYGIGRISQQSGITPEYFLTDALGNVRQLTDQSGAVILAKSYQPYGAEVSSVGSGNSSYGFSGEMTDPTGLTYLRARYYASDTGRFTSRDTWGGNYNQPLSLNRWNYVEGNPVNRVDPTGHDYNNGETAPDRRDLTDWLPSAAVYMATDPSILTIRNLNSNKNYDEKALGAYYFYNLVHAGARFDVKLKIQLRLGRSIKLGENWYEYSTPGNILFGFYGAAAGYDSELLHVGAGFAQVNDVRGWLWKVTWECDPDPGPYPGLGESLNYLDTSDDAHAIDFGIWLYKKYFVPTGSFTKDNFLEGLTTSPFVALGLAKKPDPGDYKPDTTGLDPLYLPDQFDQ